MKFFEWAGNLVGVLVVAIVITASTTALLWAVQALLAAVKGF